MGQFAPSTTTATGTLAVPGGTAPVDPHALPGFTQVEDLEFLRRLIRRLASDGELSIDAGDKTKWIPRVIEELGRRRSRFIKSRKLTVPGGAFERDSMIASALVSWYIETRKKRDRMYDASLATVSEVYDAASRDAEVLLSNGVMNRELILGSTKSGRFQQAVTNGLNPPKRGVLASTVGMLSVPLLVIIMAIAGTVIVLWMFQALHPRWIAWIVTAILVALILAVAFTRNKREGKWKSAWEVAFWTFLGFIVASLIFLIGAAAGANGAVGPPPQLPVAPNCPEGSITACKNDAQNAQNAVTQAVKDAQNGKDPTAEVCIANQILNKFVGSEVYAPECK